MVGQWDVYATEGIANPLQLSNEEELHTRLSVPAIRTRLEPVEQALDLGQARGLWSKKIQTKASPSETKLRQGAIQYCLKMSPRFLVFREKKTALVFRFPFLEAPNRHPQAKVLRFGPRLVRRPRVRTHPWQTRRACTCQQRPKPVDLRRYHAVVKACLILALHCVGRCSCSKLTHGWLVVLRKEIPSFPSNTIQTEVPTLDTLQ